MGRFGIHLLLEDNTWITKCHMSRNSTYSSSFTEWSLLNLDITESNYGIRLFYDEIDTPHANLCFKNITITHSVY